MSQFQPQALYSAEAEKAVLGCMLAQPHEVIPDASILSKGDFFVPAHQSIFEVILALFNLGSAIDIMLVHGELVDRKLAERVGSPGILAELLVGFATYLNVGGYIIRVKEKSALRALQSACVAIVDDIMNMPDTVAAILDRAEKAVCSINRAGAKNQILTAADCVNAYRVQREAIQIGEVSTRVQTGLHAIDHGNGGLPMPSYVIIAGEQGSGKSALILAILRNCCAMGYGVGGFSLEMTEQQLIQRLVAERAQMDSRRLNGKLHPSEEANVEWALNDIEKWNFRIDPTSGLRPSDIRKGTRRMVDAGCKIVWLDNAQLMRGSDDRETRVMQLTEVSRTIQDIQKEHDIIFILVCQITRSAKKGKQPLNAYDLADCSAFESDARVVILLDKDHSIENPPAKATPVIVNVAKYSEGSTGSFGAVFDKAEQRII